MASICNDEQAACGVMSGHDRKTLSLSEGVDETNRMRTNRSRSAQCGLSLPALQSSPSIIEAGKAEGGLTDGG
jgi:hypothetical protein